MTSRAAVPTCWSARSGGLAEFLEHRSHLGMDRVDRLERADHRPELDDLALVVDAYDIDPVDVLVVDGGLEFEDRGVAGEDLLGVAEPSRAVGRGRSGGAAAAPRE